MGLLKVPGGNKPDNTLSMRNKCCFNSSNSARVTYRSALVEGGYGVVCIVVAAGWLGSVSSPITLERENRRDC